MSDIIKEFNDFDEQTAEYPPKYQDLLDTAIKEAKPDTEIKNDLMLKEKINDIISGKVIIPDSEFQDEFYKRFYQEKLFVALFNTDEYQRLFCEDANLSDVQRLSSVKFIISNIFREFLYTIGAIEYFTEYDGNFMCIINISKVYSRMNVISALKKTYDNIKNYFGINIRMALSSEIRDVKHFLYRGYSEALVAQEYFKINDTDYVLSYADMVKNEFTPDFYDIPKSDRNTFTELFKSVYNSDYDGAKNNIISILKDYFNSSELSFSTFKYVTYEITVNLINEFRESIIDDIYISEIFRHKTIPVDELFTLAEHICNNIGESKFSKKVSKDRKETLVKEIVKYVERNYDDIDLNIAKIAYNFDYVPSYISKIFKNVMNVSLIDFVNKKRIAEAKYLLVNTDKILNDIAAKTGFCSDAALIRIFKKYEGTTPIAYKKDYYKKV